MSFRESKGHNLPEPSWDKVQELIAALKEFTEVKVKSNLERLNNGLFYNNTKKD